MRRAVSSFTVLIVCLLATSCRFDGIQSMALPGGVGTGDGALTVTVELPDVGTLTPNGEVKVGDVAVGTVTRIRAVNWHAEATLSLEPDVSLPANAVARVGVNSLLGASYVELAAPDAEQPRGHLASGATIPLSRGEAYPATEQVLASASVVLNGSGLEQLSTITRELNRALSGRHRAVKNLLPRLSSFVGALDAQKTDIIAAIENLDQLATRFAKNRGTMTRAIDKVGPALATLSRERTKLTGALTALDKLGRVAVPLVKASQADLVANLRDVAPALHALSKAGDSVVRALGFAITFPFAPETVANACRGDYCNLFLTIDLTTDALTNGLLTPSGQPGLPGLPGLPTLPMLPGLSTLPDLPGTLSLPGLSGADSADGGLGGILDSLLLGRAATTQDGATK